MKKIVVGGSDVSASQLKDLFRQIDDGSLTGSHIQAVIEHRNPFEIPIDTKSQLERICALYGQAFGIAIDPASVVIPEHQSGFDRLLVIPKGLTMNQLVKFFRTKFQVSPYIENLDGAVNENDRINTETYAIWLRDVVEADKELKNLSANQLKEQQIPGITLLERLVYELVYFSETGKHLDLQNWTLCSGSRNSDGKVPGVDWREGDRGLRVSWSYSGYRFESLRSRAVVS